MSVFKVVVMWVKAIIIVSQFIHLTFSIQPFMSVSAVAEAVFSLNAHCRTVFPFWSK
jgi:hypothetical protein